MFNPVLDKKIKIFGLALVGTIGATVLLLYFASHPRFKDVGYRPEQPIPFSHKLHSGQLGIQCMYCHSGVEKSAHSPIPPTSTCMNCHIAVKTESPKIKLIQESWDNNKPIEWRRIHKLPDFAQFNHSRHIRAQIDCKSCHGPVEEMGVVSQWKPLSMGWCLDCHRNPEANIVPARPISGIFRYDHENPSDISKMIGVKANDYDPSAKIKQAKLIDIVEPSFGQKASELPKKQVEGIPVPKHPGIGPENCSSCHH